MRDHFQFQLNGIGFVHRFKYIVQYVHVTTVKLIGQDHSPLHELYIILLAIIRWTRAHWF